MSCNAYYFSDGTSEGTTTSVNHGVTTITGTDYDRIEFTDAGWIDDEDSACPNKSVDMSPIAWGANLDVRVAPAGALKHVNLSV